jgi:hypothetical protein
VLLVPASMCFRAFDVYCLWDFSLSLSVSLSTLLRSHANYKTSNVPNSSRQTPVRQGWSLCICLRLHARRNSHDYFRHTVGTLSLLPRFRFPYSKCLFTDSNHLHNDPDSPQASTIHPKLSNNTLGVYYVSNTRHPPMGHLRRN